MTNSKLTKPSLRQQAIQNVCHREERKSQKEIAQEYRRLLYRSQMRKADPNTLAKIKDIYAHLPSIHSMGESYVRRGVCNLLEDYIQKKRYHPRTLKELEDYKLTGRWPPSMCGENLASSILWDSEEDSED